MKINYIKTIGFRKFNKVFETELYDITKISGKNRSGKSNLLYAIINIILGTNLSGDEKSCLINKNCDASYGELHFTDNRGEKHVLIRGKHKFDNKKNFITLDGKNITQNELTCFYKEKKLFLSIINPLYFLSKKPAEQKEMVDIYLSDIRPFEIFNTLNAEEQDFLITKYYKKDLPFNELSTDEQKDFINLNMHNIFMDLSYNNLSQDEKEFLEGSIPRDIPSYISELNSDIKNSQAVINTLNGKIEYAQNIANQQLPERQEFEKEVELQLARQELSFLTANTNITNKENQKKVVERLEKELLNKETEINELDKTMKDGKKKYLEIKNNDNCKCPTCNQDIKDESRLKTIENMKNDLTNAFNRKNLLETQKKDLALSLTMERCKYHSLEGETSVDKSKQISIVEDTIKQLENEKLEIEKKNSEISVKEKDILNAKNDIEKFYNEINLHNKCIEDITKAKQVVQKLYISYIESKMNLAKKYLKEVDIKFYSILKTTGEIKEDFIINYNNTPLSDLSRSETIATALEFANMFNQIARTNFPIFIDDYESCADYDFIKKYASNQQIIISSVNKGKALKIEDYNNINNYIIIKAKIKGYKTMNLKTRKAVLIKNAA